MISTSFILFERKECNEIKSPSHYSKVIENNNPDEIISKWLNDNDNIVDTVTDVFFEKKNNVFLVQRYVHNVLNIPYYKVLDIEFLYVEEKKENFVINRYPNANNNSIDLQSTIIESIVSCNILDHNVSLYVLVLLSDNDEHKNINQAVDRYLLTEQKNNNIAHHYNLLSDSDYFSTIFHFPDRKTEIKTSIRAYNDVTENKYETLFESKNIIIPNIAINNEQKREYKLLVDEIGRTGELRMNELKNIFNREMNMQINIEEKKNLLRNNVMHLFQYLNDDSDSEEEKDFESVRIIIPEDKLDSVVNSFLYITKSNHNLKIIDQTCCSICKVDYEDHDCVANIIKCGHLFHYNCIKTWLVSYNHKCPICRIGSDITMSV